MLSPLTHYTLHKLTLKCQMTNVLGCARCCKHMGDLLVILSVSRSGQDVFSSLQSSRVSESDKADAVFHASLIYNNGFSCFRAIAVS